ncbi:MAG TPA: pyridoxal-dependent decarboxylase, partial [Blastocatellia bacterium]|nr:pyridoxal-dependent decarboxylase [Blastocatellia bacterium]
PPAQGPCVLGDMSPEEFRRFGREVVDWIADYLAHPENHTVLSQVRPRYLKDELPRQAPARGEAMADILADIDRLITPGVTHWNHPAFFAYFDSSGSGPGILGEMFAAAFNVNAMLWRTSPAATELEEVTLDWLRQMTGLSEAFSGVVYDTASISTLCAIAAAREAVPGLRVRERGLAAARQSGEQSSRAGATGPASNPDPGYKFIEAAGDAASIGSAVRMRLYASEHAHSSIEKAAITLGLGQEAVRKIGTDRLFRLDPVELEKAIDEDRAAGFVPFCVVATVGTTSTTSIDPVPQIAEICKRERLWLHVDAAYGGSAAVVPEMRWVLEGSDDADSVVINPHKWLFVPLDLSVLYCKRMAVLRQAFSLVPEYLRTDAGDEVHNFMDYGPQLGRRFRAIKLWFVLRYFGAEGLAARIREHIALAHEFAEWVALSPDFQLRAPVPFSNVCFRAQAMIAEPLLDSLNERLMEEVNRRGKIFLSHTKLGEKLTLRLAIGNIRTTRAHVKLAWDELNAALALLKVEAGRG